MKIIEIGSPLLKELHALHGLKKDEIINQVEQDYQEYAKELSALHCTLRTVSDERDVS